MNHKNWFRVNVVSLILVLIVWQVALAAEFTLTSPKMKDSDQMVNEQVYNGFGCNGKNASPELHWANVPGGTKSLALTVYDPDAPTGSGWWHWVIFNIDPKVNGLAANAGDVRAQLAPAGSVQSRTDFNTNGYGGPCPPAGDRPHRYIFTLFALDVDKLPLDETVPAAMVGFFLNRHMIQKAQMTMLYAREK
jgi:Raf kinase inhibitor-like YbhB/YbcL family protein